MSFNLNQKKQPSPKTPIKEFGFPQRATNAFESEKISTIGELLEFSEQDLLGLPNFGKTALKEVVSVLNTYGLILGNQIYAEDFEPHSPQPQQDSKSKIDLKSPISNLNLSKRAINSLKSVEINSIQQLMELETNDLLRIPNLGRIATEQIEKALSLVKITDSLKPEVDEQNESALLESRIANGKFPNLTVKSNVWIDIDKPAHDEKSAIGQANLEKVKKIIPGDYKLDFIRLENPMINPNNKDLLKKELTKRQLEDYKAYRFFYRHNSEGWIRSEEY